MAAEVYPPYTVKIADTVKPPDHADWVESTQLICSSLVRGLAPTLAQATLRFHFGSIAYPGEAMQYVAPLDIQGKFVLIECPTKSIEWIGYVRDKGLVQWATEIFEEEERITGGDQEFTAVGLEYFLGRQQISGKSSRNADRSTRPYAYNAGDGDGRDIDEAARANKDPESDEFSFESDAVLWNAESIVLHLLAEQCPRNVDDGQSPVLWELHESASDYLNWYQPTIKVEGRSLLDVLDDVIDRRRGLTWWVETQTLFEVSVAAVIHVSSIVTDSLELPDGELPEAGTIVTFDDPDSYGLIQPPTIIRDGTRHYDRIRVRGARRTSTFSAVGPAVEVGVSGYVFDYPVPTHVEVAWGENDSVAYLEGVRPTLDGAGQTEYDAMSEPEQEDWNDRFRQKARFERVWRYYTIDTDNVNSPIIHQATGSILGQYTIERRVCRLLRTTPLLAGYDYNDATAPTAEDEIPQGPEFLRPLVLFYTNSDVSIGDMMGEDDGGWRFAHELTSHDEGFTTNYSFTPLAGEPGFILDAPSGMPHALANPEAAELLAASKYPVELSWARMLVTVTAEWDAYCEAVWPIATPEANPIQELLIQIGDRARFDWLDQGTVYDIDSEGHPQHVETAGAVRDDRNLCETIARLAYQWYSPLRAQVTFQFRGVEEPFGLGDLITTLNTGTALETINAVVSQISHDLEAGGTTISCGFAELSFSGFG